VAELLTGLPPLEPLTAKLLILGSMPGAASLAAQQYYAHPRNLFWPFVAEVFGFTPVPEDYAARVAALTRRGVAVWDVLHRCERPGSLDAAIVRSSEAPNDFAAFLRRHPGVRAIALNGQAAHTAFLRHVIKPGLLGADAPPLIALPSTSPANAGIPVAEKLSRWQALAGVLNG